MQKQTQRKRQFPYHLYFFVLSVFQALILTQQLFEHNVSALQVVNTVLYLTVARLFWSRRNKDLRRNYGDIRKR